MRIAYKSYFGVGVGIETFKYLLLLDKSKDQELVDAYNADKNMNPEEFIKTHSDVLKLREGLLLTLPFVRISIM